MRRKIAAIVHLVIAMILCITSCANPGSTSGLSTEVPKMTVLSDSISEEGRLVAEVLLDSSINIVKGSNESPHVAWDTVNGAAYYAVCMYDETANWLHWFVLDLSKTELKQGEYTSRNEYIGPYPPRDSGQHNYRIEVFALKQAVGRADIKLNERQSYSDIEKALDRASNGGNNIIARGSIIGRHRN